MTRLTLDTQIYVEALRSSAGFDTLLGHYVQSGGLICLSAVVAQELMTGARERESGAVEQSVLQYFVDRARVLTPSFEAWKRSGEAIAKLHARRRIYRTSITKSFVNDTLIAASCAEEQVTLVTRNTRDFKLIAEEIPFQFVEPWP